MASAPHYMMDVAWAPCILSLPFFHPLSLSLLPPFSIISSCICLCLETGEDFSTLSPNCPIIVWLYHLSSLLGTDTIFTLTSYWARFFFYPFLSLSLLVCTLSFPSPSVVSTGTRFSSIPKSFLYTTTAKQTPGTF